MGHPEQNQLATGKVNDPAFDTPEATYYLAESKLSPRTLERWRLQGRGPKYVKLGRRVVYYQSDLDEWRKRQRRQSTSETA